MFEIAVQDYKRRIEVQKRRAEQRVPPKGPRSITSKARLVVFDLGSSLARGRLDTEQKILLVSRLSPRLPRQTHRAAAAAAADIYIAVVSLPNLRRLALVHSKSPTSASFSFTPHQGKKAPLDLKNKSSLWHETTSMLVSQVQHQLRTSILLHLLILLWESLMWSNEKRSSSLAKNR
ncbi:hypothetical protein EJB05_44808, partial [Eragrostis curvula]